MKKPRIAARVWVCLLAALGAAAAYPQAPGTKSLSRAPTGDKQGELQLAQAKRNPLQLRQFLKKMPKGGDLHYHLSGGTYAETMLGDAVDDGLCVDVPKLTLANCREGEERTETVSLRKAFEDPRLYDELIDAFSMRSFVPSAGASGHDHFFETFARFRALGTAHYAEWADEAAQRAALQNEQYLEVMENPDFSDTRKIAREIGWKEDLKALRDELLARNLRENVRTAVEQVQSVDRKRRESEHCGQPDALAACAVDVRFIYQILRGLPKEIVFAQMVLAFEAASADPKHIVGINLVMPEDGPVAMADYSLHMGMLKYLHEVYPAVHITLHAGELAFGLVPPSALCCHVRLAVEAGAERIGHATDVMYEDRPHELLKEMKAKHVMVETCLTSSELILGVTGERHPFPLIRQFQVPVALSTDDEGVSRIDLTHEYQRAVETYDLSYGALKTMVRTSLEHAFLPGASLWREQDEFTRTAPACARDIAGTDKPSAGCGEFLRSNEKARQQWELERRFRLFESEF
jgi:adenosine deaminase